MDLLSSYTGESISEAGIRPEKPLGEGVRELAIGVMPDYQASECLEILPIEPLQIFHIEAFAIFAQMRAALKLFDELYSGRIVYLEAVGVVADNIDPSGTACSAGTNQRAIMPCRCESQ